MLQHMPKYVRLSTASNHPIAGKGKHLIEDDVRASVIEEHA
jgi:hypothetical protein